MMLFSTNINMACIKTDKVTFPQDFQLEISPGWFLDIDVQQVQ